MHTTNQSKIIKISPDTAPSDYHIILYAKDTRKWVDQFDNIRNRVIFPMGKSNTARKICFTAFFNKTLIFPKHSQNFLKVHIMHNIYGINA